MSTGLEVKLNYSDGFAGRDYYLTIGDFGYSLGSCGPYVFGISTPGGPEDERLARERAKVILRENHPGIKVDIDAMPFQWNGCM